MSAEKSSSVTVRIAGEDHTIRANVAAEYTLKCAQLVDDRIHEIRAKSGLIEGHKAAILAALSIADEYFQALEEVERVHRQVAARAAEIRRRVETGLGAGGGG
jgi:cell division protein ZapA